MLRRRATDKLKFALDSSERVVYKGYVNTSIGSLLNNNFGVNCAVEKHAIKQYFSSMISEETSSHIGLN